MTYNKRGVVRNMNVIINMNGKKVNKILPKFSFFYQCIPIQEGQISWGGFEHMLPSDSI